MSIYRPIIKPKKKNPLRQKIGVAYFRLKRHMFWFLSDLRISEIRKLPLLHNFFIVKSPLLRNLRDVDPVLEQNKIINLRIALKKIDGVTVKPGEVFSFWKMVGNTTARKGYVHGVVLRDGSFASDIGGGLCHLSGLIYWTALHTPLTVIERHRHSYDTTPDKFYGSDATCFYNYKDLMLGNDTDQPFQLEISIIDDHLVVAWTTNLRPKFKYELYEKESLIHKEDWGAYTRHNIVHRRKCTMRGEMISDEFVAENHAIMMYPPEE